jgi:hypothetical protein
MEHALRLQRLQHIYLPQLLVRHSLLHLQLCQITALRESLAQPVDISSEC